MEKRFKEIMKQGKEKGTVLSDEEILYILTQAAKKEASLRDLTVTEKLFGTVEDLAHDIFTYLLLKDARGKQGIRWMQENLSVEHIKNSLFVFVRNEYNGNLRKKKVNNMVYNTDSLDRPLDENLEDGVKNTLVDTIADIYEKDINEIDEVNGYIDLVKAIECISDKEDSRYLLKYKDRPTSRFSFRKLATIMYELSTGVQVKAKDLKDVIYEYNQDTDTYLPADAKSIGKLFNEMRKGLRMNSEFKSAIGRESF